MTYIVQRDGQQPLDTEYVYYGGTDELKPGYAVCYDIAAPLTEGSDGFNEKVRGRVIAKPVTANLTLFAGIVIDPPQKGVDPSGSTKGWCTIAKLRAGAWVKALSNVSATAGATYLRVTNLGGFNLVAEATATTRTVNTVAVAGETLDTSSTAANALVVGTGN